MEPAKNAKRESYKLKISVLLVLYFLSALCGSEKGLGLP